MTPTTAGTVLARSKVPTQTTLPTKPGGESATPALAEYHTRECSEPVQGSGLLLLERCFFTFSTKVNDGPRSAPRQNNAASVSISLAICLSYRRSIDRANHTTPEAASISIR